MSPLSDVRKRLLPRRQGGATSAEQPPQDRRHLFIVTYGKSGSTLLMGLLNSLPGYQIMGENGGVLLDLIQYHQKATKFRDKWTFEEPLGPAHPWYGIDQYPQEVGYARMADLVTDTLLRPRPETTVAGFKEIRWWKVSPTAYLDFIDHLYPGARYILNTRNLEHVATSSWWKRDPAALENLGKLERKLKRAVESRGERGYHIHYDDYVADRSRLQDLCEWLGEDYDAERFDEVMAVKHTTRRESPDD